MNDSNNLTFEIIEKVVTPIILLIAGFYFGNKSKKVEVDIEKIKELNIVLSNMLNCWHYLNRLSELLYFQDDKANTLIFPKQYLPFITLKSGTLNDNCFQELEESIESLKQYDPICYFELEGIGKKFDFIRTNYIVPFLKSSQTENHSNNSISRTFLDKLLNNIEQHLRETAKQISKSTYEKIEYKIQSSLESDLKELKEDFNHEYYEIMLSLLPESNVKPTYEEFLSEFNKPETQKEIQTQLDFIIKNGMDKIISLMIENPHLTIDELEEILTKNN
ncbi:hypothetical protein [Flavobacterium sp.]|jgi:hypothetical protein|uniref:hypothetical protein n=1 Tax=Flavobacterium sp. TaxID=239 RepID=UPI002FD8A5F5